MRAFVVALSVLITSSLHAAIALRATLDPDVTLPGLPVAVRIIAANDGAAPLTLPLKFAVQVIPAASGEPAFFGKGAFEHSSASILPEEYRQSLTIAPKETMELYVPLGGSLAEPGLFFDPRLQKPGTYRLRIIMSDALTTNEMLLAINEPAGDEKAAIDRLLTESGGRRFCELDARRQIAIARKIWSELPRSTYAAHVAIMASPVTDEERRSIDALVLTVKPSPLIVDQLHLRDAWEESRKGEGAILRGDLEGATAHADAARQSLESLIRESLTDLGKRRAKRQLSVLPTRQQIVERIASLPRK